MLLVGSPDGLRSVRQVGERLGDDWEFLLTEK